MHGYGCYDPCGLGYGAPAYAAPVAPRGTGFALIVVLFILLIIVGAAWYPGV